MAEEAKWYVVHTYSGYENKVKDNIEKYVENHDMYDVIPEVLIPTEEIVDGEKTKTSKLFPGYVLVKMIMNPETWFVVRNTRGVTGFVGPASKPVPLSDEDMQRMGVSSSRISEVKIKLGDEVNIMSGPMEGFTGKVTGIDPERGKVNIAVSMFGRETPAELDLAQVEKIEL